jgi:hypothetical protein
MGGMVSIGSINWAAVHCSGVGAHPVAIRMNRLTARIDMKIFVFMILLSNETAR